MTPINNITIIDLLVWSPPYLAQRPCVGPNLAFWSGTLSPCLADGPRRTVLIRGGGGQRLEDEVRPAATLLRTLADLEGDTASDGKSTADVTAPPLLHRTPAPPPSPPTVGKITFHSPLFSQDWTVTCLCQIKKNLPTDLHLERLIESINGIKAKVASV
jgi:hypothetical protein